ncbi:MAG TPA: DNA repair protein RecO [Gemmatimonadaceae bacterium]|nr:DNA repair protein RecO [Gemmatimonadaceae bacterium]
MLLTTEAIVLHCFDYSETSVIVRLLTRDAGVQSAMARGARRAKSRFGTALDLFAQGAAQIHLKQGRELQTLGAFDIANGRAEIGTDLGRFASASALVELVLRFGAADETNEEMFDALADALDQIAASDAARAGEAGLAGAWRLVSQLGFAPSLDACALCHDELGQDAPAPFSHAAGGVLCVRCAAHHPGARALPPNARAAIGAWCDTGSSASAPLVPRELRAHQRLLREFLHHHVADGRALNAFDVWELGAWSTA